MEKVEYKEIKPEDFFNKTDSMYIRVIWHPEEKAFQFSVKNMIPEYTEELEALIIFVRGMLEFGMQNSKMLYSIGEQSLEAEAKAEELGLTPEQAKLFGMVPEGTA